MKDDKREFTNGIDVAVVRPSMGHDDGWEIILNGTLQPSIYASYIDAADQAELLLTTPVKHPLESEKERALHTGENGITSVLVRIETRRLLALPAKTLYNLAKNILAPGGTITDFGFDVVSGDESSSLLRLAAKVCQL